MIDLSICNYTYDTSASTWHTYLIQNVILTTIKYHRSKLITYKQYFTKDFGLYGAILNLKGAIPDIMTELIVYRSISFRAQ